MTIQDISKFIGLHWNTIFEIVKKRLEKNIPQAKYLRCLTKIGIDEIAIKKQHKYLTIVIDHLTGRIVWSCEGRTKESLTKFLKRLKRLKAPVEVVTMDMWKPFISEVSELLPDAKFVLDKFHIVFNINKAIDTLRRQEYYQMSEDDQQIMKGHRYLLLKHNSSLDEDSKLKLKQLFDINQNISLAYQLKESLNQFWDLTDKEHAKSYLTSWCNMALNPHSNQLRRLQKHFYAIVISLQIISITVSPMLELKE